jgi:hypothetical protein
MLYVTVYGGKAWSVILGEEQGLRMFENILLRKIFGRNRVEVTVGERKFNNEELCNLCSQSPIPEL